MNEIMALDIGTGTVIGLIARQSEGELRLLSREERRYPERVVKEGRIVDVAHAAEFVEDLVDRLCDDADVQLNTAHYAVAGRGLDSQSRTQSLDLGSPREITQSDWDELNRKRSKEASDRVVIDSEVVRCVVDGDPVDNPVGQFGRHLKAEWFISTIPMREIENKRNVLTQAGLVPGQALLEPRAVMRASVSPTEFTAPLSVIDFGAGTIDAAYLEDGHVKDFVTFLGSGDDITRRIQEETRTSFSEAESVKIKSNQDDVRFRDIGGEERWLSRDCLERLIIPVLKEQIAKLEEWFADRRPHLLFLAGGGSQFEFTRRLVSRILGMDEADVVSGPPNLPDHCVDDKHLVQSSADFTALGMVLLVAEGNSRRYLRIDLNGTPHARLIHDELTAGELCEELGYASREPTPDSAMMVRLDGEWETFRSDVRLEPLVEVDGEPVDDGYILRSGDQVTLEPPQKPKAVEKRVKDCLPEDVLTVKFDDREFQLSPFLMNNEGHRLDADELLVDGGEYETRTTFTADDVLGTIEAKTGRKPEAPLWKIDGQFVTRREFQTGETVRLVEGCPVESVGLGTASPPPDGETPIRTPLN